MSKSPADFNVSGGLMGLGTDMMIQVMHEMRSIRDIQNFLGLTKVTKSLLQHPQFHWSTETALSDKTGTKALICQRLPIAVAAVHPNPSAELTSKREGATYVFDITKEPEIKTVEGQRIKSICVQQKNLKIDNNLSFYGFMIVYVDGCGVLRKKMCDFGNLRDPVERTPKEKVWMDTLKMPPETVKFVKVKSGGNITAALDEKGNIWTRGWKADGTPKEEEEFEIHPQFKADEKGCLDSTLGRSKVKNFTFEQIHLQVLLENGAVLAFGYIQEYQTYDSSIPADGFIQLTDSKKYKPKFFDAVCGSIDKSEGPYGIFGKHKPVKYFKRFHTYLTADGIPLYRMLQEVDRKNQFFYTALDLKWFGGEKLVDFNLHKDEVFITESGKMIVMTRRRESDEIVEKLSKPKAQRQLEIDPKRLKMSMFCSPSYVSTLRDDGRLTAYSLKAGDESTKDVTEWATEMSKDEKNPNGMVIKWFGCCLPPYYFLFE